MRVAVMAGTPIDTEMGACYLRARGFETANYPTGKDPIDQTRFQTMDPVERENIIRALLEEIKSNGIDRVFVYCNSLSGTVDFPRLALEYGLKIVTPLMVYARMADQYRLLAVMAANCQSIAGIERTIVNASPETIVLGFASLKIIGEIEDQVPPQEILDRNGIAGLLASYEAAGAEALILGCTHHPYFKREITAMTSMPVIDPAEEMVAML